MFIYSLFICHDITHVFNANVWSDLFKLIKAGSLPWLWREDDEDPGRLVEDAEELLVEDHLGQLLFNFGLGKINLLGDVFDLWAKNIDLKKELSKQEEFDKFLTILKLRYYLATLSLWVKKVKKGYIIANKRKKRKSTCRLPELWSKAQWFCTNFVPTWSGTMCLNDEQRFCLPWVLCYIFLQFL